MITEDDPNHRRLRNMVRAQFTPQAISQLAVPWSITPSGSSRKRERGTL